VEHQEHNIGCAIWVLTLILDNDWKEWKLDDELAGFYTRFLVPNTDTTAIHFQTVRSAGHMVPQTQPKKGYYLLDRYLNFYK